MNKDALLATFIGFIVGLLVTGLILYGPGLTKNLPKIQFPKLSFSLPQFGKPKATPTPAPPEVKKEHAVTIESPLPDTLEQTDKVLISGSTTPESTVILTGTVDDSVVQANAEGKYAGKVTLTEGKNDLSVTSFDGKGTAVTASVSVFYTPEEW